LGIEASHAVVDGVEHVATGEAEGQARGKGRQIFRAPVWGRQRYPP